MAVFVVLKKVIVVVAVAVVGLARGSCTLL